jgi:putative nucleotidyltransferase with HDIG domain
LFNGDLLRLGEGRPGQMALERRIVLIRDLRQEPTYLATGQPANPGGFVGYAGVPLIAKGQVKGVLEVFQREPLQASAEWMEFLETLAGQAAIALDNADLYEELQQSHTKLALAYDATIEGWSSALDLRDKETEGHSQRVTQLSLALAAAMGVTGEDLRHLRWGALLHDIGKMGIPDAILLKPAELTAAEWAIMRQHPALAYALLAPIAYLRPALDIPYCHHEKWDGTGYPRGLRGEQIPLAARIFTVVDVWDALLSDRPYRPAWTQDEAREHIRSLAGIQFDPEVVQAFLQMV